MFGLSELRFQLGLQLPAPLLELLQLLLSVMAAGWDTETSTVIVSYRPLCSLSTIQRRRADRVNDRGHEL